MEDRCEALHRLGKKTVTKEELRQIFHYGVSDEKALFSLIGALVEEGTLKPVKASGTNGNQRYPLYLRYRISPEEDMFSEERGEIGSLHPILQSNGVLMKKPEKYRQYRDQLCKLDRYLFRRDGKPVPVSRKERSFELFGDEKQLEDRSFCRLLERLGLDRDTLFFYDTPEYCFHDFIPERRQRMTLLICENKDIWFNIRRRMFEDGAYELFGTHLDGVVYGCGNQVSQKEALTIYTGFMGGAEIHYLYWGDIDRAGFNIYLGLCRNNPALHPRLFLPAYEEMLRLAQTLTIPDSEDKREYMDDYEPLYQIFPEGLRGFLKRSIRENKRIPQEIISYARLREVMR